MAKLSTHYVPAGIAALLEHGASLTSIGNVMGLEYQQVSRRMKGLNPWLLDEVVALAQFIGCEPADLFSAKIVERPIPRELLNRRNLTTEEGRNIRGEVKVAPPRGRVVLVTPPPKVRPRKPDNDAQPTLFDRQHG